MEKEIVGNRRKTPVAWIRLDANPEIGSGHLARCMSIADAMDQNRITPVFIIASSHTGTNSDTAVSVIPAPLQQRGYQCIVLPTDYRQMEAELPVLQKHLSDSTGFLLVDSYFVTKHYLEQLNRLLPVYYIDDIMCPDYQIAGLINYNVYAPSMPYQKEPKVQIERKDQTARQDQTKSTYTRFLLGSSYAPVRSEFRNVKCRINKHIEKVMITSGGADKYNACGKIAELLAKQYPAIQFHVISGAFNQHLPDLQKLDEQHSNIVLHINVMKMSEIMAQCDLAIASAGSTMYELCAVGLPTITYYFVDNQKLIAEAMARETGVPNVGDLSVQEEIVLQNILDSFELLKESESRRKEISESMSRLVDGKGAARIARELEEHITNTSSQF